MSILDTIIELKKREVNDLPEGTVEAQDLSKALASRGPVRGFADALRRPRKGDIALIAEVKKASPSKGLIRADFNPVEIAKAYQKAGASCLSVLTDKPFFQGELDYLGQIRKAVELPLLRKDFIIDERQILESVQWGADAILLIVAVLGDERLGHFYRLAREGGLDVLVETHNVWELKRALSVGAELIGVNNRDLQTFEVDLSTTERLAKVLFSKSGAMETLLVSESGIDSRADVMRLKNCGAGAILVGESLMRSDCLEERVGELLGLGLE